MSKKVHDMSLERYCARESKESLSASNLGSSRSSMISRNIGKLKMSEIERRKSMKRSSRTVLPVGNATLKNSKNFGIPEDAAVHFGNFYCLEKKLNNNKANDNDGRTNKLELPVRDSPKSEFTRQMVHKLEKLAGTEYYARQISALLEETVESPNYVVNQPPEDDFIPYERNDLLNYPLWYKDPDKMNYRNPTIELSSPIESRKDVSRCTSQISENTSDGALIYSISNDDSRQDLTECTSNYETSSIPSKATFNLTESTEDERDFDEFKIDILVK